MEVGDYWNAILIKQEKQAFPTVETNLKNKTNSVFSIYPLFIFKQITIKLFLTFFK